MNARAIRTSGLPFRILANGDTAMVVEFGDRIDLAVNARVLALADRIAEQPIDGVVETVPTFRSLMIAFDPGRVAFSTLADRVSRLLDRGSARPHPGRLWRLPVCYDPEVAPDLPEAAERAGLTAEAFASRHAAITHHVYMLGFLPGQPYLGDLPSELALPRRETPRTRVAAGSVGVAARMTCLFPKETPCGLNIIGRTPAILWDPDRAAASLLAPGDDIVFERVDLDGFGRLADEAAAGALVLTPALGAAEPMGRAA